MSITYLKKAAKTPETEADNARKVVEEMLANIEKNGEQAVRDYSRKLDKWDGAIVVTPEEIEARTRDIPASVKRDIEFAADKRNDAQQIHPDKQRYDRGDGSIEDVVVGDVSNVPTKSPGGQQPQQRRDNRARPYLAESQPAIRSNLVEQRGAEYDAAKRQYKTHGLAQQMDPAGEFGTVAGEADRV